LFLGSIPRPRGCAESPVKPRNMSVQGDTGSGTTISAIPAQRWRGAAAGGGSGRRKILAGASYQPGAGLHRGLGALPP
jgi:hypothetical protein